MKPFGCPFCPATFDSPAKLYGHGPQCKSDQINSLTDAERKAIIRKAVEEGNERILRG